MKEEVEQLLPLIRKGEISEAEITGITSKIRQAIQDDPAKGKELGQLFSLIKQAQKSHISAEPVNWVAVAGGWLAIGHKPGGKISFEGMQYTGTNTVLT